MAWTGLGGSGGIDANVSQWGTNEKCPALWTSGRSVEQPLPVEVVSGLGPDAQSMPDRGESPSSRLRRTISERHSLRIALAGWRLGSPLEPMTRVDLRKAP